MPSLINRLALGEIQDVIKSSPSVILVDASGLKAEESLGLRRELHQAGASMRVAKARLVRQALPEDLGALLEGGGSLGVIGTEDIAAAAKIVDKLAKDERLTVRAGLVEGRALDAKAAATLASLPSKPELQAKLVGLLAAPMTNLVRLLNAPSQNLALLLNAYKQKKEESGE